VGKETPSGKGVPSAREAGEPSVNEAGEVAAMKSLWRLGEVQRALARRGGDKARGSWVLPGGGVVVAVKLKTEAEAGGREERVWPAGRGGRMDKVGGTTLTRKVSRLPAEERMTRGMESAGA
jgi:hypothetical protein